MAKVKQVSSYDGAQWLGPYDIGVDANNVDIRKENGNFTNLQEVLGTPSGNEGDPVLKRLKKVERDVQNKADASSLDSVLTSYLKSDGNGSSTTVNSYDAATYKLNEGNFNDISLTPQVGDTQKTLWSKFNAFRARVSRQLLNVADKMVRPSIASSYGDDDIYNAKAVNNYLNAVVGFPTPTRPLGGTIAEQLVTLTNNSKGVRVQRFQFTNSENSHIFNPRDLFGVGMQFVIVLSGNNGASNSFNIDHYSYWTGIVLSDNNASKLITLQSGGTPINSNSITTSTNSFVISKNYDWSPLMITFMSIGDRG